MQASVKLAEAARILAVELISLQLRYLQTLTRRLLPFGRFFVMSAA